MSNIFFKFALITTLCFSLVGCSTIRFTSKGKVPVKFEAHEENQREVLLKGTKHFYLWGLIPNKHTVYIDEVVDQAGFENASQVTISQDREPLNILISILTFGLYIPQAYSISVFTGEE